MKRLLTLVLALAAATLLSGCVQMHMEAEIEKDGSGTLDMTVTLSDVLVEVMNEDTGVDDMDELSGMMDMEKSELEKKIKGHGVKLKTFEKGEFNGKQGMHIVVDFQDLEGMSYAMTAITNENEGGLAVYDLGNGNYALRQFDYGWPEEADEMEAEAEEEPESMEDMDPEQMQKQMALMGRLMGAMGELEVAMRITVPGDIIETNAPTSEGRTSIWKIDSSNMMTAGTDMEPDIVFSAKGLKIKELKQP